MEQTVKPLNQGQQAAADGFFAFLFSEQKELIISGPGGVGKTFLMGHLIDNILPQYFQSCQLMGIPAEYNEVVMTATTNKAAEVLSHSTGRPTETVHSFLNLKVTDDYSTGEQKLEKTNQWRIHQQKIIFVDESSMIDKALLAMVREGTIKCKIIYVGDHCQLAPVKEAISPIYAQSLPFFELTEPMRTDVPALQALNAQLRQTVETGEFQPISMVPGIIDHLSSEEMEADLIANFVELDTGNRIAAYTNNRVIDYNEFIRQVRGLPASFVQGETLINNTAMRLKGGMISVEEELVLFDVARKTEMVEIEAGVELEVCYSTLENTFGDMHTGVPIPVDYPHFRELIKYYQKRKNWNRYFYLKNTFPDLRQRDAATVYKLQGSTCDTVYIDLGDISTCRNANQAARLLYVAVSRPRTRIKFFGQLASKFGGLNQ